MEIHNQLIRMECRRLRANQIQTFGIGQGHSFGKFDVSMISAIISDLQSLCTASQSVDFSTRAIDLVY